jgi:hypothetical protein
MDNQNETSAPTPQPEPTPIDLVELERIKQRLFQQQNVSLATIAGFVAALLGAGIWTGVTVATKYQIGYMAIGVGFLVGFAVRYFGKGLVPLYGYVGGGLSLFGCVLGNFMTTCVFVGQDQSIPLLQILSNMTPSLAGEILKVSFQPMDLLFYGIAVYAGYQYSFRTLTDADLEKLDAKVS